MTPFQETAQRIRREVNLHDLAEALGLERPGGRGNYHSPTHQDKTPSLSIYTRGGEQFWKDHSEDKGGDHFELVKFVLGLEFKASLLWICERFGIAPPAERAHGRKELSKIEWIAEQCLSRPERALDYLAERGIGEAVAKAAIEKKTVGFNDWTNPEVPAGQAGHAGPAVAFVVRTRNPGHVAAVDMRFVEPALNGGLKTRSQGEKHGQPWVADWGGFSKAARVVVVESAINALSVATADETAFAVAVRGTANARNIDWRFCQGKRVVICFDNDALNEHGRRPGPEAAWGLYDHLTRLQISAFLVDQSGWKVNDANDLLREEGAEGLRMALRNLDRWAIPGRPGDETAHSGPTRVFLPATDERQYWRYRVDADHSHLFRTETDKQSGEEKEILTDLCGFRIAAISRIEVNDPTTALTGDRKPPRAYFAVSTQDSYHPRGLRRSVCEFRELQNVDWWRSHAGAVYQPAALLRLVGIWGRAAHLGERQVTNFVGICWQAGRLSVNEGADCFFTDPDKQCLYHDLAFHSGQAREAAPVINAYQNTFRGNAGLHALVWAVGAHLKAVLGFWPHLQMQARKGTGKTVFLNALQRSVGFKGLSPDAIDTGFRRNAALGYTSQPVAWDEINTRNKQTLAAAVGSLQGAYQYSQFFGYQSMTPFLLCAPVLLAGEEVDADGLAGKLVRTSLKIQGPMIPPSLPPFPMRQWLEFLAALQPEQVRALMAEDLTNCRRYCRAEANDPGARRMVQNYAAVVTAWRLLCQFADLPETQGDFVQSWLAEMNNHIAQTAHTREPWVWIMEALLAEIEAGAFKLPYAVDKCDWTVDCLLIRPTHVMHHLRGSPGLRELWSTLPIKTAAVLKQQWEDVGVIYKDRVDVTINNRRFSHMTALSLEKLAEFGLTVSREDDR